MFCVWISIFLDISRNLLEHSPESPGTFPESSWTSFGIFLNIPRNLLEHSPQSSRAFPGIFNNIPWNLLEHSPESSRTLPGIFSRIPRNAKIRTFSGILVNIPCVLCIAPYSIPHFCIPGFINSRFQKLKISFSEILFQKRPPHASLILLF